MADTDNMEGTGKMAVVLLRRQVTILLPALPETELQIQRQDCQKTVLDHDDKMDVLFHNYICDY